MTNSKQSERCQNNGGEKEGKNIMNRVLSCRNSFSLY